MKKKKCHSENFALLANHRTKINKSEKIYKIAESFLWAEKPMRHENDSDNNRT